MIVMKTDVNESVLPPEGQNVTYQAMLEQAEHDVPRAQTEQDAASTETVYEEITDPQSIAEVNRHSWKGMLADCIGREVIVTFLIGTQNTVTVRGRLEEVGNDFISLYSPERGSHISCDIYSIKFAEMYGDETPCHKKA